MLLSLSAFVFLYALQPTELREFGLREAIELALAESPEIARKREALKASRSLYFESLSAFGPKIDGTLEYQRRKDPVAGGQARFDGTSFNIYRFDLEANQPLYQRGSFAALRQSELRQQIQQLELQIAKRDLIHEIIRTAYEVLFLQKKRSLLRKTKNVFTENLRFTRERQRIGQSLRLDVFQIESEIALINPQITQAESELEIEQAALSRLLHLSPQQKPVIQETITPPTQKNLTSLFGSKATETQELQRLRNEFKSQKEQQVIELAEHWPDLEAVGNFGRSGPEKNDLFDADFNEWAFGFRLNIPIFSSFSYWTERRKLEASQRQKAFEVADLEREESFEKQRAKENLEALYKLQQSSVKARNLVQKTLREARKQYKLASIDYFRLLDSEQNLLQSELDLLESNRRLMNGILDYFKAHSLSAMDLVELLN